MLSHQLRFRHYYLSCRILSTVNIDRWPLYEKPLFPFPFRVGDSGGEVHCQNCQSLANLSSLASNGSNAKENFSCFASLQPFCVFPWTVSVSWNNVGQTTGEICLENNAYRLFIENTCFFKHTRSIHKSHQKTCSVMPTPLVSRPTRFFRSG